jgi:hypothetical protein
MRRFLILFAILLVIVGLAWPWIENVYAIPPSRASQPNRHVAQCAATSDVIPRSGSHYSRPNTST